MKLSIQNIGKLREASVVLDGITVVAGENDTGKSTIGKALYAVFNSFCDVKRQISDSREESVHQAVFFVLFSKHASFPRRIKLSNISRMIVNEFPPEGYNAMLLEDRLIAAFGEFGEKPFSKGTIDPSILEKAADRINQALMLSDEEILKSLAERKLYAEFNGQIANLFFDSPGEIALTIQNQSLAIAVDWDSVLGMEGSLDLRTEAIYIDDPLVADDFLTVVLM